MKDLNSVDLSEPATDPAGPAMVFDDLTKLLCHGIRASIQSLGNFLPSLTLHDPNSHGGSHDSQRQAHGFKRAGDLL